MDRERKGVFWGIVSILAVALFVVGPYGCSDSEDKGGSEDPITPSGSDAGDEPDAGQEPGEPDAGQEPAEPDAGEEPGEPDAGEEPAEPDAGEPPYEPVACDEPIDSADPDSVGPSGYRPIVFVHGGAGSLDQFETQALRFVSNGYPADHISGFEYDSTMGLNTMEDIEQGLDAHIDRVLEETGATQVDLLGHSFGTTQSHNYLGSDRVEKAEQAAKVAHYVNIDGRTSEQPPGCVNTLAIYAGMSAYRRPRDPETREPIGEIRRIPDEERGQIGGATNVFFDGVTHVEAASYERSFVEMYKFFRDGEEPETTDVLPGDSDDIELGGRVIYFATNDAPQDFVLELYEIDGDTGFRLDETPEETAEIDGDGEFGPLQAKAGVHYEFVIFDEDNRDETTQHYYYEPFIRSDYWVRLKTSPPDGISSLAVRDEFHVGLVIVRNMEFVGNADDELYADEEDLANDSLMVNEFELCTPELSPASNNTIGIFVTDNNNDGETDLSQWIESFAAITFISGADVFLASSDPPDATIKIVVKNRQNPDNEQVINMPNWMSMKHKSLVQFNDFVQ